MVFGGANNKWTVIVILALCVMVIFYFLGWSRTNVVKDRHFDTKTQLGSQKKHLKDDFGSLDGKSSPLVSEENLNKNNEGNLNRKKNGNLNKNTDGNLNRNNVGNLKKNNVGNLNRNKNGNLNRKKNGTVNMNKDENLNQNNVGNLKKNNRLRNNRNLLDVYSYKKDESADCFPLPSADHKELVCSYKPGKDDFISKVLHQKNGLWESDMVWRIKRLMKENPDFGFIDIGANLGVYLVTIASMKRQVLGVEPFPPTLTLLANTLQRNPHLLTYIRLVTNPLSDRYEYVDFFAQKFEKHPGATQLHSKDVAERGGIPTDHVKVKNVHSAPTIKTDDLLPLITFKRAILKIDIEGGEMKAFKSATRLFAEIDIRYVLLEWALKWKQPEEALFIIEFFAVRGYSATDPNRPSRKLALNVAASRFWPFDVMWIKT